MHAKDVPGLKETVRQYEEKLATFSVFNDALQKENQKLRESLEESQAPKSATDQEVQELKSEFARRMATVERDKARLKEKNDQLRTKLTSLSQGGSSTQARLKEREDYIASLQKEGEALARKNGELEANLRKLRAGSQEGEAERLRLLNRLKQQDGILDSERERSEKVAAQQSQKVAQLQTELEALQQTATEQIHAALREGAGAAQAALDQAKRGGDSALQDSLHREASLADQLERSRLEKEESEAHWSEQEELLRREIHTLETKIMAQEVQVSESLSDASAGNKDLLRQIEAMAAASRLQNETHALAESRLHRQIRNLQAAEMEARAAESSCMEKLSSQAQALENLGTALHEEQELRGGVEIRMSSEEKRCKDLAEQCTDLEQDLLKLKAKLEAESVQHDTTRLDLQKQLWHAEEQAASLRQELGDANKRIEAVSQNKAAKSRESSGLEGETTDHPLDFREVNGTAHSVSAPTSDPQKEASLDTHLSRLFWPGDSETVARSSQKNGVIKGHREENASDMELLQKRVSNAEILAELAQEELFKACKRAEQYQSDANKFTHAQNALQALRAQHDLALELLGERNERVDSLEDDIQEMKHLFHTQLSSLVDELNSLRGGLG